MGEPRRLRAWVRRYLVAELAGLAGALLAAALAAPWTSERWALIAFAASLGETIGFYAGFLITRYLREDLAGSPRQRMAIIVAAAVVEFGPADLADTFVVRPAAMFLGSVIGGNVLVGVLVGKLAADLVFYGLAITSYEVLVRRLLRRLRPATIEQPAVDRFVVGEAVVERSVTAAETRTSEPPNGPVW